MKMVDILRCLWSQGHLGGPAGPTPSANSRGKGRKGGPGPGLPSSNWGGGPTGGRCPSWFLLSSPFHQLQVLSRQQESLGDGGRSNKALSREGREDH